MAVEAEESGRYRQKRRTRAAIVAATSELLRSGVTPSVGEIADAADVSRRTVYSYFPTLEQLLLKHARPVTTTEPNGAKAIVYTRK